MADEIKNNTVVDDGEEKAEKARPVLMPPAPPQAEPPDDRAAAAVATKPERTGLLPVTAKQFTQARGIRWERAAGFLFFAKQKYGDGHRMTVPEWTQVHAAYLTKPVR